MNWASKTALILDRSRPFSRWANTVGVAVLFLTVCLTFFDVFLRYVFNKPIKGVWEITGLMLVVVVFLGIAHTHVEKGHVAVDLITGRLSPRGWLVFDTVNTILGVGIFIILVWRSFAHFLRFWEVGAVHSPTIPIPSSPFAAIIVLGCTLLLLLLLRDLFNNLAEAQRLHLRGYLWLAMFGIPVLVMVLAALWMQPTLWQLSLPTIGIIGLVCSLLFFLAGMPISFALIITGFLFIAHIQGTNAALDIAGAELYRTTSGYVWAVVAFFVLMGCICLFAGFGEDLYYTAYKWFGRVPGGLAQATIVACTAFAAIVGDPLSVTTAMGTTALPEMRRYKYNDSLSTGTIVAGATLGPIIPPSISFIIYAILTQQSIGRLFVAGIVPGLLLAISFTAIIYIRCRLTPELGPLGERSTWGERLVSLKGGGPVAFLFLLVIGGIYAGIFTPCEGGGIGVAGAVIIALLMRRLTWKKFNSALLGAGKLIGMVFLILYGAILFTRFVAFCNLSGVLTQFVTGLAVSPTIIVLIMLLLFFVLGFILDTMPMILIGVPIVHPVAVALGADPVWFTVMVVLVIHVGMITPPVGFILFALKGVARDIPIGTIYRGVFPFVLATLAVIGLIFILPSLATWLPNLLR